jgi:molecular chaperone DnaK
MAPRRAAPPPYLGIDFGTTTSLVAWGRPVDDVRGIEPVVLPVPQDELDSAADCLPTLLYFAGARKLVVGEAAREQLGLRPARVLRRLKQLLGRFPRVAVAGRTYATVDLAAAVLRRLKRAAEAALGTKVGDVVITVPASFDVVRRRALLDAAVAAGFALHGHTLLDEPVAALAGWLHERQVRRPGRGELDFGSARTVLMLDVGGGTSDACVARVRPDGDALAVELLALSRFTPVGGDDFDACVARALVERFCARSGLDLAALPKGDRLLFEHRMILTAERVKRDVAAPPVNGEAPVAQIRQMFLHGDHHLVERIDRARYAELVAPLLAGPAGRADDAPASVLDAPWDALRKAGLEPGALDAVLLAGGMALVPAVQDAVRASLGHEPIVVPGPVTAIVAGAVVQHFAVAGGKPGLRPAAAIAAESIGVRTAGGGFRRLIGAGTPLPAHVLERGAFVLPDGWGRYVRIPIAEGEDGRPDRSRLLTTLALRFPRRLAAGERVSLEVTLDENKVLAVRGFLQNDPAVAAEARLRVGDEAGDVDG